MSTYSKNEILEEIQDMVNFYKRKVVNYRGKNIRFKRLLY